MMIVTSGNRGCKARKEETGGAMETTKCNKKSEFTLDSLKPGEAQSSVQERTREEDRKDHKTNDEEPPLVVEREDFLTTNLRKDTADTNTCYSKKAPDKRNASNKQPEGALKEKTSTKEIGCKNGLKKSNEKSKSSSTEQNAAVWKFKQHISTLQFETKFMGLASVTTVFYCMAHHTIYELIYGLVVEITEMRVQSLSLLYGGLLMLGLVLMRLTGMIWLFLSTEHYRKWKAELKRRGNGESWETKFQDWLDDRPQLKTAMEIVGFYLCYIGVSFFWNSFLTCFLDQKQSILEQLPSATQRDTRTSANESLEGEEVCSASPILDEEDDEFIYNKVAKAAYYHYSGSVEAPLFTAPTAFLVNVVATSLSMYVLSRTGLPFGDNW